MKPLCYCSSTCLPGSTPVTISCTYFDLSTTSTRRLLSNWPRKKKQRACKQNLLKKKLFCSLDCHLDTERSEIVGLNLENSHSIVQGRDWVITGKVNLRHVGISIFEFVQYVVHTVDLGSQSDTPFLWSSANEKSIKFDSIQIAVLRTFPLQKFLPEIIVWVVHCVPG